MIRTALLLARTSLLSLLFLAAALLTIVSILGDAPDDSAAAPPPLAATLVPLPKPRPQTGDAPAAMRIALFDPERRPETVAGSIDDLRGLAAAPPPPANVAISGVLIEGTRAKAMLAVTGAAARWSPVGAEVGGWRVASITAEGAVLEHDGRNLVLKVSDRLKARDHARSGNDAGTAEAPGSTGGSPGASPADALVAPDPVGPPTP